MNLHAIRLILLFLSLVAVPTGCRLYEPPRYERLAIPAGAPAIRVLMIGDSLTYYNDMPGVLQQLSAREAKPIYIEPITTAGTSLWFHWNLDDSRNRIARGHFDFVILQDFS